MKPITKVHARRSNQRMTPPTDEGASSSFHNLLNRKQAAAQLGIGIRTLDEHVRAGRLVVVRLGKRRLFRQADLELFVSQRTVGGAS